MSNQEKPNPIHTPAEESIVRIDAQDILIESEDNRVKLTHVPSGIVAYGDEKSLHRSRESAMRSLRQKLHTPAEAPTNREQPEAAGPIELLAKLRDLAACCYQFAGANNAPVEWLDTLSAAANGRPFDTEHLLPYCPKTPVGAQCKCGHSQSSHLRGKGACAAGEGTWCHCEVFAPAEAQEPICAACGQPRGEHSKGMLHCPGQTRYSFTTPAEAQAETTLSQPNLEPGWLSQAISAPERPLEEVVKGAYNPYDSEAQKYTRVPSQPVCAKGGLWPYPCSGRLTLQKNGWMKGSFLCEEHAGYALRHPPLESPAEVQAVKPAPSAPDRSQVGRPISEERLKEKLHSVRVQAAAARISADRYSANLRTEDESIIRELLALRTENAALLAAVNRSNELDREAAAKIVALEKQVEQANREAFYCDIHGVQLQREACSRVAPCPECRSVAWNEGRESVRREGLEQADSARKVQPNKEER